MHLFFGVPNTSQIRASKCFSERLFRGNAYQVRRLGPESLFRGIAYQVWRLPAVSGKLSFGTLKKMEVILKSFGASSRMAS